LLIPLVEWQKLTAQSAVVETARLPCSHSAVDLSGEIRLYKRKIKNKLFTLFARRVETGALPEVTTCNAVCLKLIILLVSGIKRVTHRATTDRQR